MAEEIEKLEVSEIEENGKAKGGYARAEALTPDQRSAIAKKAAEARWKTPVPKAEYTGSIAFGDYKVPCAVAEIDGKVIRFVVQREVSGLLTGNKKGGLDRYLRPKNLEPFIPEKFKNKTLDQAAYIVEMNGRKAQVYEGNDIVDFCDMYLRARKAKALLPSQIHLADQAEFIVTVLAKIGITALIDEATGYQQVRAIDALQAYLEQLIRAELAAWAKRFPDEFYQQMFRLKNWPWSGKSSRRPMLAARLTADVVYSRLGPGILDKLREKNPPNEKGQRKHRHHQWLTDDVGHPMLAQHLYAVIGLMRMSQTWDQFMDFLNTAYPKQDERQLKLFI